mgnify:CR=1 FL=1
MNIVSTLQESFKYAFFNFNKRVKEGFPPVLILTIVFNLLNYLISNEIATKFTIFIFSLVIMLITSAIGICVHEEIIKNKKFNFLGEFFTKKNLKYLIGFVLISFIAMSPIIGFFILKESIIINQNSSGLFIILWVFTTILALKLIFILPRIATQKDYKLNLFEANNIGSQLFLLISIITIIFLLPSFIFLFFQVTILKSFAGLSVLLKPLFDLGSFYISYMNYLVFFASISFSYKMSLIKK